MGKKLISLLICVMISAVALLGCSQSRNLEIVGEWVPTTATINGTRVRYDELGAGDDEFKFIFYENGNCKATIAGITEDAPYTFNDTAVDIEINGQSHKLLYENGSLTLSLNYSEGYTAVTFVRVSES